jgi:nucleotide-binding universal stress UspA family protein
MAVRSDRKEQEMSKILVAIDGLQGSEKALEAAVEQARVGDGRVTALAVLERPGDPYLERLAEGVKAQACEQLQDVLEAAGNFARSRGVQLIPVLREGHPAETIIAYAEEEGAELIVLGSHNGSSRHHGLGGSADQVSNHAPCTVMIVK